MYRTDLFDFKWKSNRIKLGVNHYCQIITDEFAFTIHSNNYNHILR